MRRDDARALVLATLIVDVADGYIPASRGTALVLHGDDAGDRAWMLDALKREGYRRAAATEGVCHVACMAYEEGARLATERLTPRGLDWHTRRAIETLNAPTYTELRNFLVGELDADERIAGRVAMQRIAREAKFRERLNVAERGRERGWL